MSLFWLLVIAISVFLLIIICIIFWATSYQGSDKTNDSDEWRGLGSSAEKALYHTLIEKFDVPEGQIFHNVYIPASNGKTSEIDVLVVSKKGLFVFECKDYGGSIYGDANRPKWLQYIGDQRNFFYSPLLQNKNHAKYLRVFFSKDRIEVPVIPIIWTTIRGDWSVKNLKDNDYIIGLNCRFGDIYENLPDSPEIAKNFNKILAKLSPLACPDESIREKHMEQVRRIQETKSRRY
ncbi:NERD domain-containing protein [Candidatus Saccharibacteria bacterium]|nr:NERD domain-containing protein [Candidatus Saccharibacteria bacterium]